MPYRHDNSILNIEITLKSNPLTSRILVRRLAVLRRTVLNTSNQNIQQTTARVILSYSPRVLFLIYSLSTLCGPVALLCCAPSCSVLDRPLVRPLVSSSISERTLIYSPSLNQWQHIYIYIYIYAYISLSFSLSLYIYIYIYICIHPLPYSIKQTLVYSDIGGCTN